MPPEGPRCSWGPSKSQNLSLLRWKLQGTCVSWLGVQEVAKKGIKPLYGPFIITCSHILYQPLVRIGFGAAKGDMLKAAQGVPPRCSENGKKDLAIFLLGVNRDHGNILYRDYIEVVFSYSLLTPSKLRDCFWGFPC